MDEIGKQAAFYRAYLPHDRSLIPTTVVMGAIVALWLCLYFVSEEQNPQTARGRRARCGGARLPTGQPLTMPKRGGAIGRPAPIGQPASVGWAAADPKSAPCAPAFVSAP